MKIGIITYWDSLDNYGQQLQCYALQTLLRSWGYDAFLIRYAPEKKKKTIVEIIAKHYFHLIGEELKLFLLNCSSLSTFVT